MWEEVFLATSPDHLDSTLPQTSYIYIDVSGTRDNTFFFFFPLNPFKLGICHLPLKRSLINRTKESHKWVMHKIKTHWRWITTGSIYAAGFAHFIGILGMTVSSVIYAQYRILWGCKMGSSKKLLALTSIYPSKLGFSRYSVVWMYKQLLTAAIQTSWF